MGIIMDATEEELKRIEKLLRQAEEIDLTMSEKVAFNHLISFTELGHFDGERLFSLCEEVLKDALARHNGGNEAYDSAFGDNKLCKCGHTYYRHFDPYEKMMAVGCKYCSHWEDVCRPGYCNEFTEDK